MRGKVSTSVKHIRGSRITPAHAGKRMQKYQKILFFQDHPRTCGEKAEFFKIECSDLGSPPHMRGKELLQNTTKLVQRITPAHAGKRRKQTVTVHLAMDHPRTCGEKQCFCYETTKILGSPPHMRGKEYIAEVELSGGRITPAHAGKRFLKSDCKPLNWDHPRTCGEKLNRQNFLTASTGSPPHMRGKAILSRASYIAFGITPAHAGKSEIFL